MKIVTVGDSIAEGLGVKGCCYSDLLRKRLDERGIATTLLNLAHTGFQISDTRKMLARIIEEEPDVVVVAHGVTEAIMRPAQNAMRYVPKRWQPRGWLDPRPYYSRKLLKRVYQFMESEVRWRLKVFLMARYGSETSMSRASYEHFLQEFIEDLLTSTKAHIILLTPCALDEQYFPLSPRSFQCYQGSTSQVAALFGKTSRVQFCDVSNRLDQWSDYFNDHFHPNVQGHEKIADALQETLRKFYHPPIAC